ncbi:ParA family protein [Marinimicrobium sp. LS-A18]|uniref:ParA family protein n=1 Tax=Marinimicrobium sp. LS-A18 TaxID=1381596 RepID=UPI000467838C|nr:AAA family ATPase [Marinimicrobium sp. LS-A18]
MKIISVFNNKGGVGKSTLSFHLAHALAEKGIKTLMVDLDPQSNLTLQCMSAEKLEELWTEEEPFIEDFQAALDETQASFSEFLSTPRSVHCHLKPIEDGVFESFELGKVYNAAPSLGLIPGRLSLHTFEDKLAKSWSDAFMGDPQALRLLTGIRRLCLDAGEKHGYDVAILDTSPSLGMMNRVIISTSTGFFVPCMPDMFSTFGLTNIGMALKTWKSQFNVMYSLLSDKKRSAFPDHFVKLLGYTIYNARRYAGQNEYDLATAHYAYASKLPSVIQEKIPKDCYAHLAEGVISEPIGGTSVMHSHNTLPSMAQKYRTPMWNVPGLPNLEPEDRSTILGNRGMYTAKQSAYHAFADELMSRVEGVED